VTEKRWGEQEAARVAMVRSLSFISDHFGITDNAMGTAKPPRTCACCGAPRCDAVVR
jgi:hypothetical protein